VVGAVACVCCDNGYMTMTRALTPAGNQINSGRLAEVCGRYGVAELSVFGSVARGEAGPDSDINLRFVLAPYARLGFAMFDLEMELSEVFERSVDLMSRDSVHPLIRDAVLGEAEVLHAA